MKFKPFMTTTNKFKDSKAKAFTKWLIKLLYRKGINAVIYDCQTHTKQIVDRVQQTGGAHIYNSVGCSGCHFYNDNKITISLPGKKVYSVDSIPCALIEDVRFVSLSPVKSGDTVVIKDVS